MCIRDSFSPASPSSFQQSTLPLPALSSRSEVLVRKRCAATMPVAMKRPAGNDGVAWGEMDGEPVIGRPERHNS
eukprot:13420020-Alexandrium_andersonii.AAC.1